MTNAERVQGSSRVTGQREKSATRTIYVVVTAGFFGLGILHTALTYPIYRTLSVPALWFAGTGLLLIAVAALNWIVVRTRARDGAVVRVVTTLNASGFVFALFVLRVLPEPQTYVLLGLFGVATALPGVLRRQTGGRAFS